MAPKGFYENLSNPHPSLEKGGEVGFENSFSEQIPSPPLIEFDCTKEFISKTLFLSFHGLTGESRKTLDARLRTSGMT
ncbi:MAG: hypothetical protein A2Y81_01825 [Nitrospirae bacterium RBG_13_43_8]|nr:MAG: hypothetical protein A2Y81_01825 [Nitrospirae bacterium RBG_13_43_8]